MENRRDDLWRGGPWEQPNPVVIPRPIPAAGKFPKTVRRRGKFGGRKKKTAAFLITLGLIVGLSGALLWQSDPLGLREEPGSDVIPSPGAPHIYVPDWDQIRGELPKAATGTGVTVEISPLAGEKLSYAQVYEKNQQSIVTVHAADRTGAGQGTGIILTEDGLVITNAHVVQDAELAWVELNNDLEYEASLVGMSEEEDLAVLKIDAQGLTPAEFGDSTLLQVGDEVSALGSPLGYRLTMTQGIISAIDRRLEVEGSPMFLLQTSAAINFGNSGGALLNDRGQVVGVTTVKIIAGDGSTEALGFAIPTQRVKYVVDHLIAGEEIRTPVLGITVEYQPGKAGLSVREIQPWSDAAAQGLAVGDQILSVNGQALHNTWDLERLKNLQNVGDTIHLEVEREGERLPFAIRLEDGEERYTEEDLLPD